MAVTIDLKNPLILSLIYAILTAVGTTLAPLAQSSIGAAIIVFFVNLVDAHLTGATTPLFKRTGGNLPPTPTTPAMVPSYDTSIYGNIVGHPLVVTIDNVASLKMGDGSVIHNAPLGSTVFTTDKDWYGDVTPAGITFSKINYLTNDDWYSTHPVHL